MRNFIYLALIGLMTLLMGCPKQKKTQEATLGTQKKQENNQSTRADVIKVKSDSSGSHSDTATGNNFTQHSATSDNSALSLRTPASLAAEFKGAVSIEVRVETKKEYDDAFEFYKSRIEGIPITASHNSVEYAASWKYGILPKDKIEILLINTSALPPDMKVLNFDKGIIGYVKLPVDCATKKEEMEAFYNWAKKTEAFEEEESPGTGPRSPRDINTSDKQGSVKTVRAVLKKKNTLLYKLKKAKEHDGVIINPPVP